MHWSARTFRLLPSAAQAAVLLAVCSVSALAACQSTRAVREMNAATHTQETIALLEGSVAQASLRTARRNVAAWEARLRGEDDESLDEIADTLDDLEAELDAGVPDGSVVGRMLGRLGEQTRAAARRTGAPPRLDELAGVLTQTGERLRSFEENP